MKTLGFFLLGWVICVHLAIAAPDQPHMRAAINLLQAAKTSDSPLPALQAARKHIRKAAPNKKGERLDALAAVDEAIAEARIGDRGKMEQKINHAIAQLHSGMAKAK